MHVIKAPSIQLFLTYLMSCIIAVIFIPTHFIHFGTFISRCKILSTIQRSGRPGSAGIFPLCFGRQSIFITLRQSSCHELLFCQFLTKCHRIIPADIFHRQIGSLEFGRIRSCHCFILCLSHFVLSQPITHSQSHLMKDFIIISTQFIFRTAHHERTRFDPNHIQIHTFCQRDRYILAL